MFEKFKEIFPDSNPHENATNLDFDKYRNLVSSDVKQFWEEIGLGTFMMGYLKTVDPKDYAQFLTEAYSPEESPVTVIAITAFADILVWENDCIKQLNFRKGTVRVAGTNFNVFANHRLTKWENIATSMDGAQFLPALERLGPCAYDECYGYFPALALGGSEKVENLQKVKLREHLMLLSGIVGTIA